VVGTLSKGDEGSLLTAIVGCSEGLTIWCIETKKEVMRRGLSSDPQEARLKKVTIDCNREDEAEYSHNISTHYHRNVAKAHR